MHAAFASGVSRNVVLAMRGVVDARPGEVQQVLECVERRWAHDSLALTDAVSRFSATTPPRQLSQHWSVVGADSIRGIGCISRWRRAWSASHPAPSLVAAIAAGPFSQSSCTPNQLPGVKSDACTFYFRTKMVGRQWAVATVCGCGPSVACNGDWSVLCQAAFLRVGRPRGRLSKPIRT